MPKITIMLMALLFTIGLVAGFRFFSPKQHVTNATELSGSRNSINTSAPELAAGTWIHSTGHKLSDFRGKVVLLEFWTFECWNCRNTIPYMNEWYKKYSGDGFTII